MKEVKRMTGVLAALVMAVLVMNSSVAMAQDSDMGITLDAGYATQYIWRGRDLFDDQGAFKTGMDFDLSKVGLEGFGFNVAGTFPLGEGGDNINAMDEIDYAVRYGTTLMPEEMYAVSVCGNYTYFSRYDNVDLDAQEIGAKIAMPNLFKMGDVSVVPAYYVGWLWNTDEGVDWGNDMTGSTPGWFHSLSLSADVPVAEDLSLDLYGDINYDDGQFLAESDWSYYTLGVSTTVPVCERVSVKPFVNYIHVMEESISIYGDDEEIVGGINMSYKF